MTGSAEPTTPLPVVMLPGLWFVTGCAIASAGILVVAGLASLPAWLLPVDLFATSLGLFLFGSFRYQIHKNPLTYGMLLVIVTTFVSLPTSAWHAEVATGGLAAWMRSHVLSFKGLDDLIHADTMLFILGLTF